MFFLTFLPHVVIYCFVFLQFNSPEAAALVLNMGLKLGKSDLTLKPIFDTASTSTVVVSGFNSPIFEVIH